MVVRMKRFIWKSGNSSYSNEQQQHRTNCEGWCHTANRIKGGILDLQFSSMTYIAVFADFVRGRHLLHTFYMWVYTQQVCLIKH